MNHRGKMHLIPTANFEDNLDGIERFLAELSDSSSFQRLLDKLFDEVLPNLDAFPLIGLDFFARMPDSIEGRNLHAKVKSIAGNQSVREYIFDDYLLLYSLHEENLYLLAIKHHKQLSFDLKGHWQNNEV